MTTPADRDLKSADAPRRLAALIEDLLHSLQGDAAARFRADWPRKWQRREPSTSCTLPVLSWMEKFACDELAVAQPLIAEVSRTASSLTWRQTYAAADVSAEFLRNYGWAEIVGTMGPLVSQRLACGFLVLGAATLYPSHHHPAEEMYIPLSGTARWQQGMGFWRTVEPGNVIHHASGEPHSIQTGAQPLLALYLWRGNTTSKSTMLN